MTFPPTGNRAARLAKAKKDIPCVAPEGMAGRLTYINASVRDDCGGPLTAEELEELLSGCDEAQKRAGREWRA